VNGGGTSNACSNAGAGTHNPHCNGGQTPGGGDIGKPCVPGKCLGTPG
jgi:hypothetical protein